LEAEPGLARRKAQDSIPSTAKEKHKTKKVQIDQCLFYKAWKGLALVTVFRLDKWNKTVMLVSC
jgi:hypothetical protein